MKRFSFLLLIFALCITQLVFGFPLKTTYQKSLVGYYSNFLSFVSNTKSFSTYSSFFDSGTTRDYALAEFISAHAKPGQTIFIWGNDGQLYKLTNTLPPGRFIVAYHIQSTQQTLAETNQAIIKNKPQFIITLAYEPPLPFTLLAYKPRFTLYGATIYEKFF